MGEAVVILTPTMFNEDTQPQGKRFLMALWLASLNVRGLRSESRMARVVGDLQRLGDSFHYQ